MYWTTSEAGNDDEPGKDDEPENRFDDYLVEQIIVASFIHH